LFFGLLPWFNQSLPLAVAGIFMARGLFEFTVVANLALLSEQVEAQRGKVLTLAGATATLGTAVGGLTGPWLYENWGVLGVGLCAAIAMSLACLLVIIGVEEPADWQKGEI
jgi:predicted MFS family arabinose efflux permease